MKKIIVLLIGLVCVVMPLIAIPSGTYAVLDVTEMMKEMYWIEQYQKWNVYNFEKPDSGSNLMVVSSIMRNGDEVNYTVQTSNATGEAYLLFMLSNLKPRTYSINENQLSYIRENYDAPIDIKEDGYIVLFYGYVVGLDREDENPTMVWVQIKDK